MINDSILPADFVVLDTEVGPIPSTLPIIIGRPFIRIADMKICVKKGIINIKVDDEKLKFKNF